jgi:acetylornithine deacetylase/succinyl-diaminopimelate desuccinylase-like protein
MKKNQHIAQLKKGYQSLLKEFISFKTVSTDMAYQKEMSKVVVWLTKHFKAHGFSVSILKGTHSNPVVCASYTVDKTAKTVLVYGHYDVQPAEKKDGWNTDPFVLTKKGDTFIARGVVDNKGQILAHMVGVFDAIKSKSLAYNVKFIIEGNEESGNPDLKKLLQKNKKALQADFILISDSEMVGTYPTLETSFRGGGNIRVSYMTASNDRHSGLFGGAIPNATLELAQLVAKLKKNNQVAVPGFYAGVIEATQKIKDEHKKLSALQPVKRLAGVKVLCTEEGISPCEQIGMRPTIEVSGFNSGYTGCGFKNIVPAKAEARINVRTVHQQNTEAVIKSVVEFIRKETPAYVDLHIEYESHGDPVFLDFTHEHVVDVKRHMTNVYQKEVLHKSGGGSIPVVADFVEVFKKPIAMVSLCNDDCNMHGVDENFNEYHLTKALQFTHQFWKNLST